MPRPDPSLLDPARYPFIYDVTTRFGDLDANLHINNVAMASILEDARGRIGYLASQQSAMIVSLGIEYLDQAFWPDPVTSCLAVETLGRTSWTVIQLLVQNGRPFAFARATAVAMADGRPTPLADNDRVRLKELGLRDGR